MPLVKFQLVIAVVALLSLLSGCTHYIYGVPQDDWRGMSESDRAEVIHTYQERRLYEERRRAAEAEMRAMEIEEQRYAYPELIHLRLVGGVFYFKGRSYQYPHQTFVLRDGETRAMHVISTQDNPRYQVKLLVRYAEGQVMLGDEQRFSHRLKYQKSWGAGEHYKEIKLRGEVQFDELELDISESSFVLPDNRDGLRRTEQPLNSLPRAMAEREKVERKKVEREKVEREKVEREKVEREKVEREKVEREKSEWEKTERKEVKREKSEWEKTERKEVKREKAKREKAKRELAERDKKQSKVRSTTLHEESSMAGDAEDAEKAACDEGQDKSGGRTSQPSNAERQGVGDGCRK
jgi:hypothetical protein